MAVEAAYKGKAAALCCSQSDTALMPYLRDMHSWLYIAQANFKAMFSDFMGSPAHTRRRWVLCNRRQVL